MKCTVYLEPSDEFKEAVGLFRKQYEFEKLPKNLHLTVMHGNYLEPQKLLQSIERIADTHSPTLVRTGKLALFTNTESGLDNELVVLIDKGPALENLHFDLISTMQPYIDWQNTTRPAGMPADGEEAYKSTGSPWFGAKYNPHSRIGRVALPFSLPDFNSLEKYSWRAKSLNVSGDLTASFPFKS